MKQVRTGGVNGKYYLACSLYREGKAKQIAVHILMLETFVGPKPAKGMHGCHKDDNEENNDLSNLYWGTPKQNARDSVNNGLNWKTKITHCPQGHEYTEANTYVYGPTGHRQCRTCIKARNKGNANADRTNCPQGHPYDEANTYRPKGAPNKRICRECGRNRALEYQRKRRRNL